ncbi:hypothetical protein KC19_6G218000 [Ceratodon purpureus]|uniref:Secreted protein n=1 Tax=Ceratodon purpureus TaxID=3225 RepID=A0A8T0HK54_CERPU|nr:hypothetical protein KC19_6G218000 [Ceratodon purpureus]
MLNCFKLSVIGVSTLVAVSCILYPGRREAGRVPVVYPRWRWRWSLRLPSLPRPSRAPLSPLSPFRPSKPRLS